MRSGEDLRPAPWAGVLVPSANPTVEPELAALLAGSATLYSARFPVMPDTTLEQRNRRYLDLYPESVLGFGSLDLAAILIGLTGPSYRLLPDGDQALVRKLSAIAGRPVITASAAIADALRALRAQRLCLVSPYPAWLTDEAAAYWRAAGHDVVQVVEISETFRAYELRADEVGSALAAVDHDAIDAVVMSGTGMITLPPILDARRLPSKPILSSNLCCAWWLRKTCGGRATDVFTRAAPELG